MDTSHARQTPSSPGDSRRFLYGAGAVAALIYVIMVLAPLVLLAAAPQPPAEGGAAVLEYIIAHKAVYLTELICFVGLSVPALVVFSALTAALADLHGGLAALGGLIGIASEIVALALGSSPQSLSGVLVHLSGQYAAAATEAQRLLLATAAEGFVAQANAVSAAGILTALAILLLSLAMLRGLFRRWIAWLGAITGALGMVMEAFRPQVGGFYAVFGLLLPVWFVCVGLKLHQLSRGHR